MKIINRTLPFTDKTEWSWPDEDEKLVQVFDHVVDIDLTMKYIDNPRVCVQAGGACGVWPLRYAQLFETVHTFEPMALNRQCLNVNVKGYDNIIVHPFGLSDKNESGDMVFDRSEHNNYGAVYFKPGSGDVKTMTIDSLELDVCDLIQLDIEGYELEALQGAVETIVKCKPVVVLEEKPLPQLSRDHKAPRYYLESLGYKEIDRVHKDVIFGC